MTECSVSGCSDGCVGFGLCSKHYQRFRRHGSTDKPPRGIPVEQRFWSQVKKGEPDQCWPWTKFIRKDGYVNFKVRGRILLAHRWSYMQVHGEIGPEIKIDHECNNRSCVNPAHLRPLTIRENTLRSAIAPAAINARKTHCPQGHPYSPENTIREKTGRRCRTCARNRRRL